MRPTQLSRQCSDNCFGECLYKLHHSPEILVREAAAKLRDQFLRQRGKNLFPGPGALITPDAVAHPPVKEGQGTVDHRNGVTPSVGDELPEILY